MIPKGWVHKVGFAAPIQDAAEDFKHVVHEINTGTGRQQGKARSKASDSIPILQHGQSTQREESKAISLKCRDRHPAVANLLRLLSCQ